MDETIAAVGEGALLRAITEVVVVAGAVVADFAGVEDEVAAVGKLRPGAEGWGAGDVAGSKEQAQQGYRWALH